MSFQFNRKPATESSNGDMDLKPFINFLVVLIPVLMLSAEFSKTTVHKLDVNREGSNPKIHEKTSISPVETRLKLTLLITDNSLTVGTNYGFLPSLNYKEYSSYIQKKNRKNVAIVANDSKENSTYNKADFDKSEILLYSLNENNSCDSAYYYNEKLVIDNAIKPMRRGSDETAISLLDNPRKKINNFKKEGLNYKPLSMYDNLQCALLQLHERYSSNAVDGNSIIIASENKVVYDKIIQLIDVSKASGFTDISISKLRS